jgi:hypothetical protein
MALQDFITAANTLGFGKKYNFQVADIKGAPFLVNSDTNFKDYLLYVETLTLPSVKTNTATVPFRAFDFNVPTNTTFPESSRWRVTFFSDEKLLIRKMFETWSKALYDPELNASDPTLYGSVTDTYKAPFGSCDLHLDLQNDKDIFEKKYIMYGVFPVLVESIEYNIGDNGDTVAKLPVTLAFQYFKPATETYSLAV